MVYLEDDPAGVRSVAHCPNLPPAPDSPVIDGIEDDGHWRLYRAETLAALGPVGFAEAELAEAIALLSWRLRRVGRLEADALAHGFARQNEAAGSPSRGRIGVCERVLAVICRYEGRIERARDRAVKDLRALQQARRAGGPTAPEPAFTPQSRMTPSPGAGALASIGKMAESLAGDRRSVAPDRSEPVASFGQNASTAASGTPATGPQPGSIPTPETTRTPGAGEPGMVASFVKTAGPRPGDPVPGPRSRSGARPSAGPTPAGAVASIGQSAGESARVAALALSPRSGWVAEPHYGEEGAEEDEWTYSSYKSYWAEQDAAARAAGASCTSKGPDGRPDG